MRPHGGNRFILVALPGGDRNVGHPSPLAPELAAGVGVAKMSGAQVIDGKIDDFRNRRALGENQQVQGRRQLHETGDHTTMDSGQQRIADVVLVGWQTEQ
ncbi:hypothetical protein D3C76_1480530 [compost metagenome]